MHTQNQHEPTNFPTSSNVPPHPNERDRIADCRELYLKYNGGSHLQIEREMRELGHTDFHRRILYRRYERGRAILGWIERYGWDRMKKYEEKRRKGEGAISGRIPIRPRSVPPAVAGGAFSKSSEVIGPDHINCQALHDLAALPPDERKGSALPASIPIYNGGRGAADIGSMNCHALQCVDTDAYQHYGGRGAADNASPLSPAFAGSVDDHAARNPALKSGAIERSRASDECGQNDQEPSVIRAESVPPAVAGGVFSERFEQNAPGAVERTAIQTHTAKQMPRQNDDTEFTEFVEWLKRVSPTMTWTWKHQVHIHKKLRQVTDGVCKRLMIFLPPRHGKSELVTVRYTAWRLKKDPSMNAIIGSYNQSLADRFSRKIRRVLADDWAMKEDSEKAGHGEGENEGAQAPVNYHAPQNAEVGCLNCHALQCVDTDAQCPHGGRGAADSGSMNCHALQCVDPDAQCPHGGRGAADKCSNMSPAGAGSKQKCGHCDPALRRSTGRDLPGQNSGAIHKNGNPRSAIRDPQSESCPFPFADPRPRNSVAEWETTMGGGLRAVGVGGGVTGYGAGLIVIDDPIRNRADAESKTHRGKVWEWYKDDLYTRLEPNGSIILIQTRWHEDDLAGRLLAEMADGGEQWTVVDLPALAESPADALGRAVGEPLCEERFGTEQLKRIRRQLGSYSFAALYQQRPVPSEGGIFKRAWFERTVDAAPPGLKWTRGYDLAVSTKTSADYTASFRVAYDADGNLYIDGGYRRRIEFPEQRRFILGRILAEPETRHGIELALHGQAMIQDLRRDPRLRGRHLSGVKVAADKTTRALTWSPLAEEGKVILVRGAWNRDFIDEVCSFPMGTHDDQIDAVSLAVSMHARRKRSLYAF